MVGERRILLGDLSERVLDRLGHGDTRPFGGRDGASRSAVKMGLAT
jgi:hypothetical protein